MDPRALRHFVPALFCLSLGSSCMVGQHPAMPTVRVRAEQDLRCAEESVRIDSLGSGRYRATGCGRSVEYTSICEHLQCTVAKDGEEPAGWRDNPEPGSLEEMR